MSAGAFDRFAGYRYVVRVAAAVIGGGNSLVFDDQTELIPADSWDTDGNRKYVLGLSGATGTFNMIYIYPASAGQTAVINAKRNRTLLKGVQFRRPDNSGYDADLVISGLRESGDFNGTLDILVTYSVQGAYTVVEPSASP